MRNRGKVYHVAVWSDDLGRYIYKSSRLLIRELGPKAAHLSPTRKSDAEEAGRLWLAEGSPRRGSHLLGDYLTAFWAADGEYAKKKRLAGEPLAGEYLSINRSAVKNHILPWLKATGRDKLPLSRVTRDLVEKLVLHLSDKGGLGASRVNGIRRALSVPLSQAAALGLISHNPARGALVLKEPRKVRRELLTPAEVLALFSGTWKDPRHYAINLLAATTGMRLGECRGLLREDLRADPLPEGTYYWIALRNNFQEKDGLKHLKSDYDSREEGAFEEIPLPTRTGEALAALVARNRWKNQFVFWGFRRGTPISKSEVEHEYASALERIGISREEQARRRLGFHAWRHWYNTMTRGRVPDHVLRRVTRHKTEEMTERYTDHLTDEQRRQITAVGEGLIAGSDQAS